MKKNLNLGNKKNIIIAMILIIVISVIWTKIYSDYKYKLERTDRREEGCRGKTIDSIEYDIDNKKCFPIKISACNKPTYKSEEECRKMNNLN